MPLFPSVPWLRSAPVTTVRLKDPLAASLGLAHDDGTVTISVVEVARAVGRLDPLVTRTFTALCEALSTLYREGVPVRGEIHADVGASSADPVAVLVGRVLTAVIAATPEDAPGRSGRLRFQGEQGGGKVRLVRTDRKDTASFPIPKPSNSGPDVAQLLDRARRGRSAGAETEALQRAIGGGHGTLGPPVISVLGVSLPATVAVTASLVRELKRLGLRVGVVRRASPPELADPEGSSSSNYSSVGATSVVTVGSAAVALYRTEAEELPLAAALSFMPPDVHVVVCEGYPDAGRPCVVVCEDGDSPAQRVAEARLLSQATPRMLATVGAHACGAVATDFERGDMDGLARHIASRLEIVAGTVSSSRT
ncbi:MAG: hypothetical protein AMXMBFR64_13790 [Myxococcales bacterium]